MFPPLPGKAGAAIPILLSQAGKLRHRETAQPPGGQVAELGSEAGTSSPAPRDVRTLMCPPRYIWGRGGWAATAPRPATGLHSPRPLPTRGSHDTEWYDGCCDKAGDNKAAPLLGASRHPCPRSLSGEIRPKRPPGALSGFDKVSAAWLYPIPPVAPVNGFVCWFTPVPSPSIWPSPAAHLPQRPKNHQRLTFWSVSNSRRFRLTPSPSCSNEKAGQRVHAWPRGN